MSRLNSIIIEQFQSKLVEEEAPVETPPAPTDTETPSEEPPAPPVDGTENIPSDDEATDDTQTPDDETQEPPLPEDGMTPVEGDESPNNFDQLDQNIEKMIGITDIQHTSSSTTIDFEDGGQLMFVQPIVSLESNTLNEISNLIIRDIKKVYSRSKDEITGKNLQNTKYWNSIDTLVETMVRSQLTKSDNIDGLVDEIKQVFKILEIK